VEALRGCHPTVARAVDRRGLPTHRRQVRPCMRQLAPAPAVSRITVDRSAQSHRHCPPRKHPGGARSCPAPAASRRRVDASASATESDRSAVSWTPSTAPSRCGTTAASVTCASSTTQIPSRYRPMSRRATSIASRVLRDPATPVNVTSRAACSRAGISTSSCSRPTKVVNVCGRLAAKAPVLSRAATAPRSRLVCSQASTRLPVCAAGQAGR
jgi:hypothetical protein